VRPAQVASPLAAHKNPRKAQIHVGPLSNWDRQERSPQYRANGSPMRDRIQVRRMRYSKRSSVARTRPSRGFFSRSDRSVFFPDGRYTRTRAGVPFVCRHLLWHAPKCRSGDSATPSIQRGPHWALFCDHYVGSKKWSKT